jgi:hypothetical protein
MGAGYTPNDATALVHDSPFLCLSSDTQLAYIGLYLHLLTMALRHGWDHAKSKLGYHMTKLKEIPLLYHQTQLQVLAHNYCYLRGLKAHSWQTFGIQYLRIRKLQANMGTLTPTRLLSSFSPTWTRNNIEASFRTGDNIVKPTAPALLTKSFTWMPIPLTCSAEALTERFVVADINHHEFDGHIFSGILGLDFFDRLLWAPLAGSRDPNKTRHA